MLNCNKFVLNKKGSPHNNKNQSLLTGRSWHAEFRFFSDPTCVTPSLLAAAEGKYALAEKSTGRVPGAVDFNFDLERAFLTLFEKGLVESLQNDGNCGPPGVWQVGDLIILLVHVGFIIYFFYCF